jgi:hypothetical protein
MKGREVDWDEGLKLASKYNMDFFETSAKTGKNVDLLFRSIFSWMVVKYQSKKPSKKS